MTPTLPPEPPPAMKLMQLITGHWVAAAVYSAARLGLAELLKDAPQISDELAERVNCHAPSLYRLLRALATLGVFEEVGPQKFALTEVGQLLRADHPESMRSMALFQGAAPHWEGWGSFLHSVRTGQPAFEHVHGQGFFDYCAADAEFGEAFNGAMTAMSAIAADAVLDVYDFSGIKKLVDVGGGHGYLLSQILGRYPRISGGIIDLPQVAAGAQKSLAKTGLDRRVEVTAGSFFDSVPKADAYIAKNIIHDWDDAHAHTILHNMRTAMIGNGRVLLVELLITPENRGTMATLIDLEMLHATHGGRERTEAEFKQLFASAGLKLKRIVATKSQFFVLEAVPA